MQEYLARTRAQEPVSKPKRQRKLTAAERFAATQYRVEVVSRGNTRSAPPPGTYTAAVVGRQQAKDGTTTDLVVDLGGRFKAVTITEAALGLTTSNPRGWTLAEPTYEPCKASAA